jgi:hypothetical protein
MVECVLAMASLNNCPSCRTDDVRRESLVMALLAVVLIASPMGTHLVSASSTTVPPVRIGVVAHYGSKHFGGGRKRERSLLD